MRKSISKELVDRSVSNYFSVKTFVYKGMDEEARFCIEKCPYKNCKGTCKEFKEFKKALSKEENINALC